LLVLISTIILIYISIVYMSSITLLREDSKIVNYGGLILTQTQQLIEINGKLFSGNATKEQLEAELEEIEILLSEFVKYLKDPMKRHNVQSETDMVYNAWNVLKEELLTKSPDDYRNMIDTYHQAFLHIISETMSITVTVSDSDSSEMVRQLFIGNFAIIIIIASITVVMQRAAHFSKMASQARQIMLDKAPMACFVRDSEFRLVDCNKEAVKMLGAISKDNIMGTMLMNFMPEYQDGGKRSDEMLAEVEEKVDELGQYQLNWTYVNLKGEIIPVEERIVRVRGEGDLSYATYSRDLRELIEAKREVAEADERLNAILDAMPMVCCFLEDYQPVYCNEVVVSIFNCSEWEFCQNFWKLMPEKQPDGSDSVAAGKERIRIAKEQGENRFEWMHRTADGEPLPSEVFLKRVNWKDGYQLAVYLVDLRRVKENELKVQEVDLQRREMEIQTAAAKASNEAKSNFLALMSHEIRTPMNAILGMSDLIKVDNLDESQLNYFRDIKLMSNSLLQIINDILDFSKIEAGMFEINPVHFNIREKLDNAASVCRFSALQKGLDFSCSVADDVPEVLYGDDIRFRQVIMNIVNNAIKYTKEGSVDIRVELAKEQGLDIVNFRVSDTGIGIKEEHLEAIFEVFRQVDGSNNRGITGTGLGLSISKNLAKLMGGDIKVKSIYGQGSEFIFTLPLKEGDASLIEKEDIGKFVVGSDRVNVLVVDDNEINRKVALAYLQKHSIVADYADSGMQAIEMVKSKDYDLVFMDHMMPEMDGIEATRIIRGLDGDKFKALPIVALTANAVSGAKEEFFEADMNDFISKPIVASHLNKVLKRWLPDDKITVVQK
jgi:PAS domain S-box-containing protein